LVGFALVNTQSHHGSSIEHNMGEFFVARKYRRLGVATKAAGEILRQYPGALVAVAERNLAARMFCPVRWRLRQAPASLFCVR
jgi:predicted acetyltransferase